MWRNSVKGPRYRVNRECAGRNGKRTVRLGVLHADSRPNGQGSGCGPSGRKELMHIHPLIATPISWDLQEGPRPRDPQTCNTLAFKRGSKSWIATVEKVGPMQKPP